MNQQRDTEFLCRPPPVGWGDPPVGWGDPPVGWGSTYCFTAVGVGVGIRVGVGVGVLVGVTPITKGPPAQIFLGGMFFVHQVNSF